MFVIHDSASDLATPDHPAGSGTRSISRRGCSQSRIPRNRPCTAVMMQRIGPKMGPKSRYLGDSSRVSIDPHNDTTKLGAIGSPRHPRIQVPFGPRHRLAIHSLCAFGDVCPCVHSLQPLMREMRVVNARDDRFHRDRERSDDVLTHTNITEYQLSRAHFLFGVMLAHLADWVKRIRSCPSATPRAPLRLWC